MWVKCGQGCGRECWKRLFVFNISSMALSIRSEGSSISFINVGFVIIKNRHCDPERSEGGSNPEVQGKGSHAITGLWPFL